MDRQQFSRGEKFNEQDQEEMDLASIGFCCAELKGYASALTNNPLLGDKSRGWSVNYAFLDAFYSNLKIVCMVRDSSIFSVRWNAIFARQACAI